MDTPASDKHKTDCIWILLLGLDVEILQYRLDAPIDFVS